MRLIEIIYPLCYDTGCLSGFIMTFSTERTGYYSPAERLWTRGIPGFWKASGDVATAVPHLLTPGMHDVPVRINLADLPSPDVFDLKTLSHLRTSVRSRFAQLGGHTFDYQTAKNLIDALGDIQDGKVDFNAVIMNTGQRPIEVMAETGLFRFFFFHYRHRAEGGDLKRLVEEGSIALDMAKEGIEWKWHHKDPESQNEHDVVGIAFRINAENRVYIPSDPGNKPIVIDHNSPGYREQIDDFTKPIPLTNRHILWIGETVAEITLNGVDAVLSNNVVSDLLYDINGCRGSQINSHLIDRNSNWRIRLEVISATTKDKIPNWVILQFIKSPSLQSL